jgi:2-polyprenyl-6-methoxyphenol hydroxylase-like FAD-dependent oxidoreductase
MFSTTDDSVRRSSSTAPGRAIVGGGGIAGLAAARALIELGWNVTVYEQAPSLKALGAGITLAPNAVRALDWLGLGDRLQSKGMAHGEAAIRDQRGRWLFRAPVEAREERFGVASFALHRADLHAMLVHAARKATLRTGYRISGLRDGPQPVVTFEGRDGPGEDRADLIIGADGIRSRTRYALFPEHPGLSYAAGGR